MTLPLPLPLPLPYDPATSPSPRAPRGHDRRGELVLRFDGDQLTVVAQTGEIRLDAASMAPGEARALAGDATVQIGGARLKLQVRTTHGDDPEVAPDPPASAAPSEIALDFLPRGGQLRMRWQGRDMKAYLGDRRCDLAAVLLQPPRPHRPGEMLPDALIASRVWPTVHRSRNDLNTLVYRLRQTLSRMSPAAAQLVARAPGGHGTCFQVAPHTRIAVR